MDDEFYKSLYSLIELFIALPGNPHIPIDGIGHGGSLRKKNIETLAKGLLVEGNVLVMAGVLVLRVMVYAVEEKPP